MKQAFKPEFLNRLDDIIVFKPLSQDQLSEIVKIQLKGVQNRLKRSKRLNLEVSKSMIQHLADLGYDPIFGARPLKRVIQSLILDEIALQIISGDVEEGNTIKIDYSDGKVIINDKVIKNSQEGIVNVGNENGDNYQSKDGTDNNGKNDDKPKNSKYIKFRD
jgi:ATP-dependent Clp protease ATP-binding subunit ClpB